MNELLLVVRRRRVPQTLIQESLKPFSLVRFARVHVALRIDRDTVGPVELTRITTALTDESDHLQRIADEDVNASVHPVGDVDESLLRINREADVPRGA